MRFCDKTSYWILKQGPGRQGLLLYRLDSAAHCGNCRKPFNNDVIMNAMASQITSRSKKISKRRVTGICKGNSPAVNSLRKGPVTRKMFPFDYVIMRWDSMVAIGSFILFVSQFSQDVTMMLLYKHTMEGTNIEKSPHAFYNTFCNWFFRQHYNKLTGIHVIKL